MSTLDDYAVFEYREVENKQKRQIPVRGWWMRGQDAYLGSVKDEARETLKLKYMIEVK